MNKELQKAVKKIVNKSYNCKFCKNRKDCRFWKGEILSLYFGGCTADEFAEGVQATLKHLASIPWDKAMHFIADSAKEDEECKEQDSMSVKKPAKAITDLLSGLLNTPTGALEKTAHTSFS